MNGIIKSIYIPIQTGMYKDNYLVTYKSGRKIWYDLKKIGEMPESHFDFIMNGKCVSIYASNYTGTYRGQHLGDKYI